MDELNKVLQNPPEGIGPPKLKKVKRSVMQEKFRWVMTENGEDVMVSPRVFLSFKACQEEVKRMSENDRQYTIDYRYEEVECLDVPALIGKVFEYLVSTEYKSKMKRNCPGCNVWGESLTPDETKGGVSHLNGCEFSPTLIPDRKILHSARSRVSFLRLTDCTRRMSSFYYIEESQITPKVVKEWMEEEEDTDWQNVFYQEREAEFSQLDDL